MAIIKCKMCGGDLALIEGASTAECEYCGSIQTIPNLDDEKKLIQFERAERLRKQCEFDKAAGIYETIVADFRQEAEAYWGLVLCKYGIEYVDDPGSGKKIPTCHRSSFESIMDDSDFEQAMENADMAARKVYREEAKAIEDIRKGIIAVSSNEEPYDIFICYKETGPNGQRTLDSVLAQDVYDALTDKGYRVFFSRITLEDKLGVEYEPYIFAALNSAKVMLTFGTDYEYFNAVWVKNEWSRFLKLMASDKEKHLIPCYKGIDAYDMPKEFAKLQAQDLGKVGAIQDLLRGIEKILPRQAEPAKETVVVQQTVATPGTTPLLKRMFLFLEDSNWDSADEYAEKVLDMDPECAEAYLGKLLAEMKVRTLETLKDCDQPFSDDPNYQKVLRFGDENLKAILAEAETTAKIRKKQAEEETAARTRREQIAAEAKADFEANAEIKHGKLKSYRGTKAEIYIPNSVTSIGDEAFLCCKALTSITIPNSVTSIGDKAFFCCESLTSITIPDSVTSIGDEAFLWCKALTSITIPNSVTSIGRNAFLGCEALTSITIPDSVTSIGEGALNGCVSLRSVTVSEENQNFRMEAGCLIDVREKTVIWGSAEAVIPEDGSVTGIGECAFYACEALTSITIPNSVTGIGECAFLSCKALTSIIIPDSVISIGVAAFCDCKALTSIKIPNSVTSIGEGAFEGCVLLKSVSVSERNKNFRMETGCLIDVREKTVIWGTAEAVIPEDGSVTGIGDRAFRQCSTLTSIVIPNSVTNIGERAFQDCEALTSTTIPNSVTSIGEGAFRGCEALTSITIPDSVTSIGKSAFSGCKSLTSITIPDSVTSIGEGAFWGCKALTSITIPNSVTSIGEGAFRGCEALTSITIPDSVTSIGKSAFSGCKSLASITIPDSVTSIGEWALSNCESLTSITIPDSLTSIGELAFYGCTKLTIYTPLGSYAEKWAKENRIPVQEEETSRQKRLAKREEEERIAKAKQEEEEKRIAKAKQEEEEKRRRAAHRAAGLCQHCGGQLKGLFSKKCVSCGRPKDY